MDVDKAVGEAAEVGFDDDDDDDDGVDVRGQVDVLAEDVMPPLGVAGDFGVGENPDDDVVPRRGEFRVSPEAEALLRLGVDRVLVLLDKFDQDFAR